LPIVAVGAGVGLVWVIVDLFKGVDGEMWEAKDE